MAVPINPAPLRTYYDPTLWNRLAPSIREHQVEKIQHLVDGRWKSMEEAREIIGFLRAIDWIFAKADDLTRVDESARPE